MWVLRKHPDRALTVPIGRREKGRKVKPRERGYEFERLKENAVWLYCACCEDQRPNTYSDLSQVTRSPASTLPVSTPVPLTHTAVSAEIERVFEIGRRSCLRASMCSGHAAMTCCGVWRGSFFFLSCFLNSHLLHTACIYVQRRVRVRQYLVCKNITGGVECIYAL
jgi:hypothetical protein